MLRALCSSREAARSVTKQDIAEVGERGQEEACLAGDPGCYLGFSRSCQSKAAQVQETEVFCADA